MSKQISLTRGLFAIVDDDTFDYLNQWKWYAYKKKKQSKSYYAARSEWNSGDVNCIKMHRLIMGLDNRSIGIVDHKDRNPLNNQKSNLRICTLLQNNYNKSKREGTSSKYIGVGFYKSSGKWRATIAENGKTSHLGTFLTEEEAGIAYNKIALERYGEFAVLNDIEEHIVEEIIKTRQASLKQQFSIFIHKQIDVFAKLNPYITIDSINSVLKNTHK
jgi:hypothetical protein